MKKLLVLFSSVVALAGCSSMRDDSTASTETYGSDGNPTYSVISEPSQIQTSAAAEISEPAGGQSASAQANKKQKQVSSNKGGEQSKAEKMIAQWPERPMLGAQVMMAKYGAPHEVTAEKIVWHNIEPYKRITVTKMENTHDFPLPHMDFIEHTINYDVPADKAEAITQYDGSCTYDRTRGELSARCDLEGHNILTLNLANDIVTGKKDAAQARKAFGETVVEDMLGKKPLYVTALQFKPTESSEFSDTPVIAGAPMRPDSKLAKDLKGDAAQGEILGLIMAVNMNEIVAAMVAVEKKLDSQVAEYAKMLHQEHGKNAQQTLQLGEKISVTPLVTPAVDDVSKKGARELAMLAPLNGEEFSRAYIDAMVKGHTEALQLIDAQVPKASNEELKKHLTETRQHVAMHLEKAKTLQGTDVQDAAGAGIEQPQKQEEQKSRDE